VNVVLAQKVGALPPVPVVVPPVPAFASGVPGTVAPLQESYAFVAK